MSLIKKTNIRKRFTLTRLSVNTVVLQSFLMQTSPARAFYIGNMGL